MGRFLAVNGSLFVLAALTVVFLAACVISRCSPLFLKVCVTARSALHLFRRTEDFSSAVTAKQARPQAARTRKFQEKEAGAESSLNGKSILIVHDDPGVLGVIEQEIRNAHADCGLQKAATYGEATTLMDSWTYELVILDIMGGRGFDLLMQAVTRPCPIPAVMLNAHALSPEALKKAMALGGYAYLPKERPGIVSFLDDVMAYEPEAAWRLLLQQIRRGAKYGLQDCRACGIKSFADLHDKSQEPSTASLCILH